MSLVRPDGSSVNRRVYFDESVFNEETERIFTKTWQFVAHESEIAEPGDYVARRLGNDPVIVSRSEDGAVHVLHNACRHRGAQLCLADLGNTSHFRCSYHGWTYSNTGQLRGVPQTPTLYRGTLKRAELGLSAARVELFHGLIFANWAHDALSLKESLGDMAWYMETVFARDYEVVGVPTRLRGHHNWKTGAENWTADGYHGDVTHKVLFGLGVALPDESVVTYAVEQGAGMPTPDEEMGDLSAFEFTAGHGHSGLMFRLPIKFERPAFIGYEPHLWDDFASQLDADQTNVAARRVVTVSTVFPNFSFIEQVLTNLGDGEPPVMSLNIRVWAPISATETEIINWVLVPKAATSEWKKASQKAFARTLSVGGIFEVDDLQNWTGMAQSNTGAIGLSTDHHFGGAPADAPTHKVSWPGHVYPGQYHDVMFREYFKEWDRWMTGDDSDPGCNQNGRTETAKLGSQVGP
ncbi:aromatic ring-hydroxylating oxygenase subunit alpha [Mycolicibacterium hodleri]|nr:aromatic ring-hydroxylating dioxygenase subunit alpha [Mycolicibacterium hodleri]